MATKSTTTTTAPIVEEVVTEEVVTEEVVTEESSEIILNQPVPEKEAPGHYSRDFNS